MKKQWHTWSRMMDWDTPENYDQRRKHLQELISRVILEFPPDGPYSTAQVKQLQEMVAERSELLHWDVYNDSFSRNNIWLYGDYLSLTSEEARFAILAFHADPNLQNSELGIAFDTYLGMVRRGRILDSYVKDWFELHPNKPV